MSILYKIVLGGMCLIIALFLMVLVFNSENERNEFTAKCQNAHGVVAWVRSSNQTICVNPDNYIMVR